MHADNPWKIAMLVVLFLFFAGVGIAHVANPDRFLKPHQRGGEMLTGWNRFEIRSLGVAFTVFSVYMIYCFLRDYFGA